MTERNNIVSTNHLINEYKKSFLLSRFIQTACGGIRISCVQRSVIASQVLVFLFPIFLGIVSSLVNYYVKVENFVISSAFGLVPIILFLLINLLPRSDTFVSRDKQQGFSLVEENEIVIKRTFSVEHLNFLFPSSSRVVVRILNPCIYGACFILMSECLRYEHVVVTLQRSFALYVVVFLFSWLSAGVALYGLVSNTPAEVATFRPHFCVREWNRPFYILLLAALISSLLLTAPHFTTAILIAYGVLSSAFALFIIGILPPIDCVFSYVLELGLVYVCAASPSSNDIRIAFGVVTSGLGVVVAYYTQQYLIVTAVAGALLSSCIVSPNIVTYKQRPLALLPLCLSLSLSVLIVAIVTYVYKPNPKPSLSFSDNTILLSILIGVFLLRLVILEVRKVYIIFRTIRNPMVIKEGLSRILTIVTEVISLILLPSLLLFYISSVFYTNTSLSPWACALLLRVYRKLWQNTVYSCLETFLFVALRGNINITDDLLLLFLCGIIIDTAQTFIEMVTFGCTIWCDFVQIKKQRIKQWRSVALINIVMLPVILAIFAFCALTGFTLLPVFTLPIFLISYPRPTRFWPTPTLSNYSSTQDTSYYKQITPHYMTTLEKFFSEHGAPRVGSFLLARAENLIIISRIMESGYGYFNCVLKGLELQETSCHTEEALVVKNMFEDAFPDHGALTSGITNKYYLHMLTPVTVKHVNTYSDARNVLTGVLDSPDCLQKIRINFVKCMIYELEGAIVDGDLIFTEPVKRTSTSGTTVKGFDFSAIKTSNVQKVKMYDTRTKKDDIFDDVSLDSWGSSSSEDVIFKNRTGKEAKYQDQSKLETDEADQSNQNPATDSVVGGGGVMFVKPVSGGEIKSATENSHEDNESARKESYTMDSEGWLRMPFLIDEYRVQMKELFTDRIIEKESSWVYKARHVAITVDRILHNEPGTKLFPHQVVRNYHNNYEWGPKLSWLQSKPMLSQIATRAYRLAVKLSIDEMVYGDSENEEEFLESVKELTSRWYIGTEKDAEWSKHIEEEIPFLFSLSLATDGSYSSRTLTLTSVPVYLGYLNTEAVKALWNSLAFELLYLTNDDEERYSIQAHASLLRNLVIQSADLPLGYPLFLSPLQTCISYFTLPSST